MEYLVTGTNRGIGLELVRQLLARGDRVIATIRAGAEADELRLLAEASGRATVVPFDVARPRDDTALRQALDGVVLDGVINNAGVMGGMSSLEDVDLEDARRTFEINALGTIGVVQLALPALSRGSTKQIVAISSGMGSIGGNTDGGAYAYRMSKAALNMAIRSMSIDLAVRGFIAVTMNPGWVQTDMGGRHAPTPVTESVRLILERLSRLTAADNGHFLDYRGGELGW